MDVIVMPFYQRAGKVVKTPDFLGVPFSEAERIVKNRNLLIAVESSEFHNSYEKGAISYQLPAPGTMIKPGRRIRVRISKGPRPKIVPDVVGKSPRDAGLLIHFQEAGQYFYMNIMFVEQLKADTGKKSFNCKDMVALCEEHPAFSYEIKTFVPPRKRNARLDLSVMF